MHGYGQYVYTDINDCYEGQWLCGLRSGKGKYRFANGNIFQGEYVIGSRQGAGVFYYVGGEAEVNVYEKGAEVGEGARWSADRSCAAFLRNGEAIEQISLEEAADVASTLGLMVPAMTVALPTVGPMPGT